MQPFPTDLTRATLLCLNLDNIFKPESEIKAPSEGGAFKPTLDHE